ncbi:hypothetical protein Leryth_009411 [Lithospermum erythrorhizon]|nr:hypothetical protein Leryth_009411 [Lithospermum erythrorhizon]
MLCNLLMGCQLICPNHVHYIATSEYFLCLLVGRPNLEWLITGCLLW